MARFIRRTSPPHRAGGRHPHALWLCICLLGLGLIASHGLTVEHAAQAPAHDTPPAAFSLSKGPQGATYQGAATRQTAAPDPIPTTDLPHCVLFSLLGNDFDPCYWFMRAIVGGANWFLTWSENLLQGFNAGFLSHDILFDTPTSVTTGNDAIHALVDDMRWIANGALVLIVIVAGINLMVRPALGLSYHDIAEFFPRFAISALGANLSLWMLDQLVGASNLFMHFVGVAPLFTPELTNLPSGANTAATLLFGSIGLVCYEIMLLLLILQIFVRLALLDLLIVISPLAIICWALPQTQRATEWWAGLTTATLILQPLQLTLISMGVTLATNIPVNDGVWGPNTVLLQICLLIATFYLCFRLPALLNYGLFRTVGGVASGVGVLAAAAQIGVAMATGNPAMAMGAGGGGGGGGSGGGGATVTEMGAAPSSTTSSGAPGLPSPSGGGMGGGGFGGYLPGPGSSPGGGGTDDGGSSGFDDDPGYTGSPGSSDPRPGAGITIEGSGYALPDDAGPLST
ncbi:MAG: hypothetical protein H0X24_00135 [Ktedonobacterales bacterium]|nr:hypothetical protein [Ktedonobacterales bacterium]